MRRRLTSFPGPSDDDDGHPNTGRLQCTPLGVVLKLDRHERHPSGEYDIWLKLILSWDSPTRLPGNANPSSPDVSLASPSLITSTNWQTKTNLGSDHLPILISLQMDLIIIPIPHRTSFNLKKANCDRYRKEIEDKLSKRLLPTNCQKGEKILRTILLKAASRHIPSGRHCIKTEPVPVEILEMMRARNDLRYRDPTSPALQQMNAEITRTTNEHRRNTCRQFVETLDNKTDPSNLLELSME